MPTSEKIPNIKAEIKELESALEGCTDSRIRELIEIRIEERKTKLSQLRKLGPRS
jgi:hypothetical protein